MSAVDLYMHNCQLTITNECEQCNEAAKAGALEFQAWLDSEEKRVTKELYPDMNAEVRL